jgi:predicted SprT family Zn-dependent metalloprotease
MTKFIDLSGKRFGRLLVVERAPKKGRRTQFICKCDCGNEKIALSDKLQSGETKSCGCLRTEIVASKNRSNAIHKINIGDIFGNLVVDAVLDTGFDLVCKCGNRAFEKQKSNLIEGRRISCGCLKSENNWKRVKRLDDEFTHFMGAITNEEACEA